MATTILRRFKFRRGDAAEWTSANPVLLDGEPGLESDTGKMKYGDGVTAWSSLPYFAGVVLWGGITGTLTDQADLVAALAAKQPLHANLTAIAALSTTSFGLGHLTLADAAALRSYAGLGTAAVKNTGTSGDAVPVLNGSACTWAAGATFGGTLTLSAASMQIDNGQYIYGKIAAGSATRMLGINSGGSCYVGSIDQAITNINFASGGSVWAQVTSTVFNLLAGMTYRINNVQVVTARQTGWGAATGTATRTAVATYTAPTISNPPTQAEVQAIADALQAWSRRTKAVTDDLATHGLIGA